MSPEEAGAALAEKIPLDVAAIHAARKEIMGDPACYRAFESKFYETVGDVAEPDASERRRQGVARYLLGQSHMARQLLADDPDLVSVFLRAELEFVSNQYTRALAEVAPVIKAKPDLLEARMLRVEALFHCADIEGLEAELREIEKRHGTDPAVHYVQGLIRELDGDYDEATRLYGVALTVDPEHQGALFHLAYHESLRGEPETAIELYERLCDTRPTPIGGLINLGLLFEDAEDYTLAANCFQRILDYDPTHHRARLYLRDSAASTRMFYDEERERKEDKRAQVLRIPVTDFELSVRSRNCLANMNVRTLGDLIRLSEQELLAFKNFGETSLTEIKEILTQKGLRLGMAANEEPAPTPTGTVSSGDRDSVLMRSVNDLDLSVRSRKALDFLQIRTIGELASTPESRMLACKNFGQTSLAEIRRKLRDYGLSLKEGS